jgi:hypothetical protein
MFASSLLVQEDRTYHLQVEVPGVTPQDLNLSVTKYHMLRISGGFNSLFLFAFLCFSLSLGFTSFFCSSFCLIEFKKPEAMGYSLRSERGTGKFQRNLWLPEGRKKAFDFSLNSVLFLPFCFLSLFIRRSDWRFIHIRF